MKVVAFFIGILAVALAGPVDSDKDAVILKSESDNIGIDGYHYSLETSNGIISEEQGQLQNPETDHESISVRGSFTFTAPDGVTYTVSYIADDNGFQPQGAHLPKAP